jgi:hypothetical protein
VVSAVIRFAMLSIMAMVIMLNPLTCGSLVTISTSTPSAAPCSTALGLESGIDERLGQGGCHPP